MPIHVLSTKGVYIHFKILKHQIVRTNAKKHSFSTELVLGSKISTVVKL